MMCSNKVPKSVRHDVTRRRKPGAVARSEACPPGMQAAPSSIPTSGTFFHGHEMISTAILLLPLIQCAPSTGKLPRRFAQEQCG